MADSSAQTSAAGNERRAAVRQSARLGFPSDMPTDQLEWLTERMVESTGYVEFGTGASTVIASRLVTGSILAVESSKDWASALAETPDLSGRLGDGTLRIHYANIGPTGKWGRPTNRPDWQMGRVYALEPLLELTQPARQRIDLVLIDGRFRVACAAAALVLLPQPPYVVIDDYVGRAHYHSIERGAGEPLIVGRAAVFMGGRANVPACLRLLADSLADSR